MDSFENSNREESLKAENDFLKMKLMLEKGATFEKGTEGYEVAPEVENEFLNHVIEFEKQWENSTYIKIVDKIGRPTHFKPVNEIPDEEMSKAWEVLFEYLNQHGISLDVCSPNISPRELYRFATEELFEQEIEDINIPGMMHGFIYDEFHPDPVYDNMRAAVDDCIEHILQKEPFAWTHHFKNENLKLNEHQSLTIGELKFLVNRFKAAYNDLAIKEITDTVCEVNSNDSHVTGKYSLSATIGNESFQLSGNWKVLFAPDIETGYWYITEVYIEGIKF